MLNGKSWPVEAVAESGDMVGDNDEVEDAIDEPLGRPPARSSSNRGLLAPSRRSIISPYSSSSTSPEVSSKSPTAGGAEAGSGTSKLSPPPSASPLSSIPIRIPVLLALCTTRGGLKLLSRPKTRITPFRALADKEEWLEEDSKRRARNEAPWIWDWFDEDDRLWLWLRSIPGLEDGVC
jgi:hypothetical protein